MTCLRPLPSSRRTHLEALLGFTQPSDAQSRGGWDVALRSLEL